MEADLRSLAVLYDVSKELAVFKGLEQSMPAILQALDRAIPLQSVVLIEGAGEAEATSVWYAHDLSPGRLDSALRSAHSAHADFTHKRPSAQPPCRSAALYPMSWLAALDRGRASASDEFMTLPLVVAGGAIFATLQVEARLAVIESDIIFAANVSNHFAVALDHHYSMLAYRTLLVDAQKARSEAIASSRRFQKLVNSLDVTVWEADAKTRNISFVSQKSEGMFGYSRRRWLEEPDFRSTIVHPDDRARVARQMHEATLAGRDFNLEYRVLAQDGKVVWVKDIVQITKTKSRRVKKLHGVMVDMTERHGVEQDLRISEEFSRQVADGIPDCIAVTDLAGRLLHLNSAGQKYFEVKDLKSILQVKWQDFWPEGVCSVQMVAALARAAAGESSAFQGFCATAVGKPRWWDVTVTPALNCAVLAERILIISRDISQITMTKELLNDAKEAAEVANQSKSAFLANMSHEIRTPLAAIVGFGELLKDQDLAMDKRLDFVETITRNGHELTHLINDILDMSKVEAGHLDVVNSVFSLSALLADIAHLLGNQAADKGIDLSFAMTTDVPDAIISDASRLRQILINVVGNALKFTDKGSVRVAVSLDHPLQDGRARIALSVKDSGPGMSPKEQEVIFRPFMQGKTLIARKFGGTGLGLVLSRTLAQKLGGDLVLAASSLGSGSNFVTTIDAGTRYGKEEIAAIDRQRRRRELPQTDTLYQAKNIAGIKILVAEDVLDNQVLIGHVLRKHGAKVDFVSDGKQAIDKALHGDYALVLMDMQMPVCDGYQATRELRRLNYRRPIVALTAFAMTEDREECLRAGCDDHLAKPLNHNSLLLMVEHYAVSLGDSECASISIDHPRDQENRH